MKSELVTKIGGAVKSAAFELRKASPKIFIIVGGVGMVAGTVLACRETMKLPAVLENSKTRIDDIHEKHKDDEEGDKSQSRELAKAYLKTGGEVALLYAPSVMTEGLGLFMILYSHHMMEKRNASLAAAYATLEFAFDKYRDGVIKKYGKETDGMLRHSLNKVKTIDDNGNEKDVYQKDPNSIDPAVDFNRVFDESSNAWIDDPLYNAYFLKNVLRCLDDKLKAVGWLTLNDAYESLGFPITEAGQSIGWIFDKNDPTCDCYVDIGLNDPINDMFNNGDSAVAYLSFNVDGYILDRAKKKGLIKRV